MGVSRGNKLFRGRGCQDGYGGYICTAGGGRSGSGLVTYVDLFLLDSWRRKYM